MSRQSNLFAFFAKAPKEEDSVELFPTESLQNVVHPVQKGVSQIKNVTKDTEIVDLDENNENTPIKPKTFKRRRVVISSDEEDENAKVNASKLSPIAKRRNEKKLDQSNMSDDDEVVNEKQINKTPITPKSTASKKVRTPQRIGAFANSFIGSFRFDESSDTLAANKTPVKSLTDISNPCTPFSKSDFTTAHNDDEGGLERFPHLDFDFLKPEKILDKKKRRPSDPGYDFKTLFVPPDFLNQQTPGHKQWWLLKLEHYDTILFFKVGKFYELYHMDAVIAVECLNLTFMRGKYAHCGFPEIGYGRFADQLINRGYKVARVEQTETPQQLEERCRKTNVKEKVVRREVCRRTTAATRTYGILDGTDDRETDGVVEPEANYLMAITEKPFKNDEKGAKSDQSSYGVCFVDCSTGHFYLSQFNDDGNNTALRTLIAHNYPSQLLFEKNFLSSTTKLLLGATLGNVPQQGLFTEKEFWSAETTIEKLLSEKYLGSDVTMWPSVLSSEMVLLSESIEKEDEIESKNKKLSVKPSPNFKLALSALGAVIWYLNDCLIDVELVTMKLFHKYLPSNLSDNLVRGAGAKSKDLFWRGRGMVLDGTSLFNLHVLPAHVLSSGSANASRRAYLNQGSTFDSTLGKFSLLNTISKCATGFGKRQLQRWLCTPSCDPTELGERQEAVRYLVESDNGSSFVGRALEMLRKIPDLERLFQRIHTLGLKYRSETHPDSRAQFFEYERYNQRKIKDLVLALHGLAVVQKLSKLFIAEEFLQRSILLERCLGNKFPEMAVDLAHFNKAFNQNRALEEGVIVPNKGVDNEYDRAVGKVEKCERELDDYLETQKRKFKCSNIKYFGTGKNSYQMEIPDSVCNKISANYSLLSQRKGFKRYSTDELNELKTQLFDAKTELSTAGAEVTRRVFSDFDNKKEKWSEIVKCIATFDCIISLVRYSQTSGLRMSFPEFVFDTSTPFLEIRVGYHPSLVSSSNSVIGNNSANNVVINYIPNDCLLGVAADETNHETKDKASTMLLTGANMGGKSTLMRQVSSLVILAQIGSMVPAERMRLTPVDRIFCRIGANDRLSAGQSTFFVELAETNIILQEATKNSLVLIDELGRGTSTHDGTAIAYAVLKHIANVIQCRTIFSTHYHAICGMISGESLMGNEEILEDFVDSKLRENVKLAHMSCMVENENTKDPTEENITFLYTLTSGPASRSYGFYTAKVAGINIEIVRRAFAASNMLKSCF